MASFVLNKTVDVLADGPDCSVIGAQNENARHSQVVHPGGAWLLVASWLCVVCSFALCAGWLVVPGRVFV